MVTTAAHEPDVGVRQRELWVDNLRVLVIAAVIVVHTATAYVLDLAGWFYDDERTTSGVWSSVLTIPVAFGALFGLGPLFLIAGWLSARSIARSGPAPFARSRLVRLGVPLVVMVVLVEPLTDYVGDLPHGTEDVAFYLRSAETTVMWFVAALLMFSLVYAASAHRLPSPASARPLRAGVLVAAAVTIGVSSFAVWTVWPLEGETFLNVRLAEWPQGAVLFALGVHAARAGWLGSLPRGLEHRLGWTAVAATLALIALIAVVPVEDDEELATRADWPTMLLAMLDGAIAVGFTLWSIGLIQRRWPSHGELLGKAGRASYATYFLHPLVLTTVMVLAAPVALAAEVKFVLVSVVAVPACFAAGYALTRLPGVSRIL